jgi:hypothetical protein
MRSAISRTNWDRLRREVYAQYDHRCGVCGAEGKLECHEMWQYDDEQHVQRLDGFIALCVWCHHVKHIGLASILAHEGRLDYGQVIEHFQRVNSCDRDTFMTRSDEAWVQWRERNNHSWTTDLGSYASLVDASASSDGGRATPTSVTMSANEHFHRAKDVVPTGTATTSGGDVEQPSTCVTAYWLYADRRLGNYPEHTLHGGKWMIFVPLGEIDRAWETIKRAVERGQLGGSAKVATALANPNALSTQERVVCVYTYDVEDRQDVFRVRAALRELGFTQKMPYKTDAATRAGQYRSLGNRRVSVYYE